jgi:hypothetical protein
MNGVNNQLRIKKMIECELINAGMQFLKEPSIKGLMPDYLIASEHGHSIIIEIKTWPSRDGNIARAWDQASYYTNIIGVTATLIVVDDLKREYPNKGVVTVEGLIPAIRRIIEVPIDRKKSIVELEGLASIEVKGFSHKSLVFAAMPFDRAFDDTYFVSMSYAADSIGAYCYRMDYELSSGNIDLTIKEKIEESIAMIADVSGANPNVLYELGYAHALRKPYVNICSTSLEDLPFDIRNYNTLKYEIGQTYQLKTPLLQRLKQALDINGQ